MFDSRFYFLLFLLLWLPPQLILICHHHIYSDNLLLLINRNQILLACGCVVVSDRSFFSSAFLAVDWKMILLFLTKNFLEVWKESWLLRGDIYITFLIIWVMFRVFSRDTWFFSWYTSLRSLFLNSREHLWWIDQFTFMAICLTFEIYKVFDFDCLALES